MKQDLAQGKATSTIIYEEYGPSVNVYGNEKILREKAFHNFLQMLGQKGYSYQIEIKTGKTCDFTEGWCGFKKHIITVDLT